MTGSDKGVHPTGPESLLPGSTGPSVDGPAPPTTDPSLPTGDPSIPTDEASVPTDDDSSASVDHTSTAGGGIGLRRAVAGAIVVLLAFGAAAIAIYRERGPFADALKSIGPWSIAGSAVSGLIGVALTYPVWREVLEGLGVDMPWGPGARVFFISQMGKYVPGSVWPVVMQMEAGKSRGASRRTMLSANLITLAMNCCVGLLIACGLLAAYDSHALAHYWWALLAIPFLLVCLHPRVLPGLMDRAFVLLRRPPLNERLESRAAGKASCWAVASWVALGVQLGFLCAGVAHGGPSDYLLSIGAMGLAVPLGVLFIPAPAGAGIRDVVLVLVLREVLPTGEALAVVIASRVILIGCDLLLAGGAVLSGRRRPRPPA